jgi:hypothetical protein
MTSTVTPTLWRGGRGGRGRLSGGDPLPLDGFLVLAICVIAATTPPGDVASDDPADPREDQEGGEAEDPRQHGCGVVVVPPFHSDTKLIHFGINLN